MPTRTNSGGGEKGEMKLTAPGKFLSKLGRFCAVNQIQIWGGKLDSHEPGPSGVPFQDDNIPKILSPSPVSFCLPSRCALKCHSSKQTTKREEGLQKRFIPPAFYLAFYDFSMEARFFSSSSFASPCQKQRRQQYVVALA